MELYFSSIGNPVAFIQRELAERFHVTVNPEKETLTCGGMFSTELFAQFVQRFQCVSITKGLPKNDYGQTVRLSERTVLPNRESLTFDNSPEHLVNEFASGRYGYFRKVDTRGNSFALEETFFFEYAPGKSVSTFSDTGRILAPLRYLSKILHKLDRFEVVFLEDGVLVHLRSHIADTYKPEFEMNC